MLLFQPISAIYSALYIIFIFWYVKPNGAVDEGLRNIAIIPSNFPDQNSASYTIRYLDSESSDGPDCLQNQSFLSPPANVSACRTLAYALNATRGGSRNRSTASGIQNLIILVTPGVYGLEQGITAKKSNGLIIAKQPAATGEVIMQCEDNDRTIYNLDIRDSQNIGINGIVATKCGPRGTAMRFVHSEKVTMTNCIFR